MTEVSILWCGSRIVNFSSKPSARVTMPSSSKKGPQYAEQLVSLARTMSVSGTEPALAIASRSDLSARVSALLDAEQSRGRAGVAQVALIVTTAAAGDAARSRRPGE